jgi:histidinol-phosphate aminotransferase
MQDTCDFIALALPGVRALEPYVPGKPVEELQRELGLRDVIKLASNENPLGASPRALAAAREALSSIHWYPDGSGYRLKQALARKLGVNMEQIALGNGSNDVLELVARSFAGPGTDVVFSEHAFAVYLLATQAVGAAPVVVPAKDWGNDLDRMLAAVGPKTRLVFIANPNNPTGTWLRRAELKDFLERLPGNVIAVVDEAYFEYVTEPDYPNSLEWLGRYPNLVVTRTFSKIYGLAGLRIGYGVAHPQIVDLMNRVRQPFNVNSLALAAAEAALEDQAHVTRSVAINSAGLLQITNKFKELQLSFIPSAGNFVCFEVGPEAAEVYQKLLQQGVIVRPVANYGMPNHLRVTIGREAENERFLISLTKALGR